VLTAVGEVDISSVADLQRALETARDDGAAEKFATGSRRPPRGPPLAAEEGGFLGFDAQRVSEGEHAANGPEFADVGRAGPAGAARTSDRRS
jgi:hypothetical protein